MGHSPVAKRVLVGSIIALLGGFSQLTLAQLALAQATEPPSQKVVELNIDAPTLARALIQLTEQTGLQLIFPAADHVAELPAQRLSGRYSPQAALDQLLKGSGLKYEFIDPRTVAIRVEGAGGDKPKRTTDASGSGSATGAAYSDAEGARASNIEQASGQTTDKGSRPTDEKEAEGKLSEIIVTAQKRQERLIDTPQAVSVISPEYLSQRGATQFRDFASSVPGLTFTTGGAGFNQVSLRGITTGLDISSTVGIYIDEVPFGSSSAFARGGRFTPDGGLFDLERIEVLRGPQGTLYGASTMGGLIKYVTKQPDSERFSGAVQTGVSTTHEGGASYNVAAEINAPIVRDKLAVRLSGFKTRDGGYIDNLALHQVDVNRSDIYGGRADLLFTPTDNLSWRLVGVLQNVSRDGAGTTDFNPGLSGTPLDTTLTQRRALAEPYDQHFRLVGSTINYEFSSLTLTSVSSYQTSKTEVVYDLSPLLIGSFAKYGPFGGVAQLEKPFTDKFTQEVRLASRGTRLIEWTIGGFYTHEDSGRSLVYLTLDPAGQRIANNLLNLSGPSLYQEYAAFGDLTWHISYNFDVTGGLRYAENRQEYTQTATGSLGRSAPTARATSDVVTYLANSRYHFNDHSTAYIRYATGYRPGGPNLVLLDPNTGLPTTSPTFNPDKLQSYEIGYKGETEERRFSIDVGTYYINWTNLQVFDLQSAFGGVTNAGGATVRGVELSLSARPTDSLTVTQAIAYQNARMSADSKSLGALKGDALPNVPRFTANVNADYVMTQLSYLPSFGMTLGYVSDRRTAYTNTAASRQHILPDYTTVGLHAGATFGNVHAQAYVSNVFDERGEISAFVFAGRPQPAILQPRTVGMTLTLDF